MAVAPVRCTLLLLTAFCLALPGPARAFQLLASASVNASVQAPNGVSTDDSDRIRVTSPPPAPLDVSADVAIDFNAPPVNLATLFDGTSRAVASTSSLGVATSMDLTAFDPNIIGSSIDTNAFASYGDTPTVIAASLIYLSPIFDLTGTLSAGADVTSSLAMTLNFFSNTAGPNNDVELFRMTSPADGSPIPVDTRVVPAAFPVSPGDFVDFSVRMVAQITVDLTTLPAGDHSALADFDDTASFLGFAAWADAAMTQPITEGVSITGSDGSSIPLVNLPEPGALQLLLTLSAVLIARRRPRRGTTGAPPAGSPAD